MKLVQASQDVFETASDCGFRTYTPTDKHFSFQLSSCELLKLQEGAVVVMTIVDGEEMPRLSIEPSPRRSQVKTWDVG